MRYPAYTDGMLDSRDLSKDEGHHLTHTYGIPEVRVLAPPISTPWLAGPCGIVIHSWCCQSRLIICQQHLGAFILSLLEWWACV